MFAAGIVRADPPADSGGAPGPSSCMLRWAGGATVNPGDDDDDEDPKRGNIEPDDDDDADEEDDDDDDEEPLWARSA